MTVPSRAANIRYWKRAAFSYNATHPEIYNLSEQRRLSNEVRRLVREVGTSFPFLDLGSGTGNVAEKLHRWGALVVACDLSKEMLVENKTENKVVCDVLMLPFKSNSFGGVTCYSVLHHFPNLDIVVKEIKRVSTRGCVLYVDHEPFKKSALLLRRYTFSLYDLFNWLLWLFLHPKHLGRLVCYVVSEREKNLKALTQLGNVETDTLNLDKVLPCLRREDFTTKVIRFKKHLLLKAHKKSLSF